MKEKTVLPRSEILAKPRRTKDKSSRADRSLSRAADKVAKASNKAKNNLFPFDNATPNTSRKLLGDCTTWVDCDNGYVRGSSSSTTCFAQCNGNCCQGLDITSTTVDACVGFTGMVCGDAGDGSCSDTVASTESTYRGSCANGNIEEVSGGSCVGQESE